MQKFELSLQVLLLLDFCKDNSRGHAQNNIFSLVFSDFRYISKQILTIELPHWNVETMSMTSETRIFTLKSNIYRSYSRA